MILAGKTAVVTGGATNIGAGIAAMFREQGADVHVLDLVDGVDVTRPETVPAVNADILVNNAGLDRKQDFLEMTESEWDRVIEVNLKSMYLMSRMMIPGMIQRGWGRIINIGAASFELGPPRLTHYLASKGGVIGFTRSLARELGPYGIAVNCVAPGMVQVVGEEQHASAEAITGVVSRQCLNRRVTIRDVAGAALYFASEMSSGVTGQTLHLDCGLVMH